MDDDRDGPFRPWRFWATAGWGAAVAAAFVIAQLVVVTIVALATIANHGGAVSDSRAAAAVVRELAVHGSVLGACSIASALLGGLVMLAAVRCCRSGTWREYLALRPVKAPALVLWLASGLLAGLAFDFAAPRLGVDEVPEFMREAVSTGGRAPWLWLGIVVAAPLFEEAFCRGFLLTGWQATSLGPWGAVALISFLWTLAHLQYGPVELAWVFLLGLLLGAARLKSGSLWTPIAMHVVLNLVGGLQAMRAVG
ncbi:MAG TPA: CPBP family intramembrane metalloprotease [Candidatus Krumholzibacteria bacterium]|nr:CPBP family intramembrane metalloprotease [Candidatus Krumholzibacteria bacterium]HPD73215.1 CPBP family intramembrane metalloprotease [Candidatus Krumholzibacteria bacterium]HRY40177.1 CPBP family intramembrane metalloprotease [Candidatus Krumholzibacteria bacterium]